jgi:hypothetical protein
MTIDSITTNALLSPSNLCRPRWTLILWFKALPLRFNPDTVTSNHRQRRTSMSTWLAYMRLPLHSRLPLRSHLPWVLRSCQRSSSCPRRHLFSRFIKATVRAVTYTTNSYHHTQIKTNQHQPSKCNPPRPCPSPAPSAVTPSTPSSSATTTTARSPTLKHPSSPALARPATSAVMAAAPATAPPPRSAHHPPPQRP